MSRYMAVSVLVYRGFVLALYDVHIHHLTKLFSDVLRHKATKIWYFNIVQIHSMVGAKLSTFASCAREKTLSK